MMVCPVGEIAMPVESGKHLVVRATREATQRQHHQEDQSEFHGDRPLGKDARMIVNNARPQKNIVGELPQPERN
jgi:hypothetical protein